MYPPDRSRSCAVICEYNPFHHGHAYQLNELKKTYGTVICILGGNLTQRGEPAVADRFVRARAAVACGADLVLELSLPWCCASASDFARGGVSIASRIGADALAFSAEYSEEDLRTAAEKRYAGEESLREMLKQHVPYPQAVENLTGLPLKDRPNSILALEYLRFAGSLPVTVVRRNPEFLSSSAIRASADPASLLPDAAADVFRTDPSFPRKSAEADPLLIGTLRNEFPNGCYAVPPELHAAIGRALPDCSSVAELTDAVKGKMFTSARIRRALWASALRISPDCAKGVPPYTLLLAANDAGCAFLKHYRGSLPVISRPAEGKEDPVFRLNLRANRMVGAVYGGPDDLRRVPYFSAPDSGADKRKE